MDRNILPGKYRRMGAVKMSTMTAKQRGQLAMYIKYDKKPPHLPIAAAESPKKLAQITGMTEGSINSMISKKRPNIAKIVLEDDE